MVKDNVLHTFINDLANLYTPYFDVYRNEQLDGLPLSFLAQYRRRDERYMLSKKIKIYGIENQQIIFATACEKAITSNFLKDFYEKIETNLDNYIIKHEEHMSTIILGMIVTNHDIDQKVLKDAKKFRKIKFLKFGLHGWAEIYLAIVNPKKKNIIIHSKGKQFVSGVDNFLKGENVAQ
ncbi:hypothetical protein FHP05_09600 [Cerasibacillus terrae]|uniref:DUF8052 domain-containing protein n=1 Tax=Cerasibacillus terrae TaxID=2498845 RepID=A0A5C8NRL0_9BACI|nr:hypothetical protein [Cerasibacillus terrae]TXL63938.1 hypothetical protein FHP05_09600 [Cerasibacillus terrae]